MPIPHPLPEPLVELVAQRFRLIGEPMRIRLLDRLRTDEQSVGELADALGATQQNVSKHLACLHQAGIVARRKDGNRVVYSIADESSSRSARPSAAACRARSRSWRNCSRDRASLPPRRRRL